MIQYGVYIIRLILIGLFCLLGLVYSNWRYLTSLGLFMFDIQGEIKKKNIEKYENFKSKPEGLIVFHHSTFYDHLVLFNEFGEGFQYFALEKHCIYPFNIFLKKVGGIIFRNGSNTVELIKEMVKNRKAGQKILAIAPNAGFTNNEDQNKLEDYKMGAFLPKTRILPILIKYDPYINWKKGQSLLSILLETFNHKRKLYSIEVLDEVNPLENETPEQYRDRVKNIMEEGMKNIDVKKDNKNFIRDQYYGSNILLTSSHVFLVAGLTAIYMKKYKLAWPMICIYIVSILYHWKGDHNFNILDQFMNRILGGYLVYLCFTQQIYIPILLTGLSLFIYIINNILKNTMFKEQNEDYIEDLDVKHMIYVHFPNFIGMMLLNYFYNYTKK